MNDNLKDATYYPNEWEKSKIIIIKLKIVNWTPLIRFFSYNFNLKKHNFNLKHTIFIV